MNCGIPQIPCIMSTRVIVYVRKADKRMLSFTSHRKRSDFHLGESQRVVAALPMTPHHRVFVRRCVVDGAVDTVQVGVMTALVPPATFVAHCTRAAWPRVVVLVSSAELLSKMIYQ